jgi:hypothetical protein
MGDLPTNENVYAMKNHIKKLPARGGTLFRDNKLGPTGQKIENKQGPCMSVHLSNLDLTDQHTTHLLKLRVHKCHTKDITIHKLTYDNLFLDTRNAKALLTVMIDKVTMIKTNT